jgi:hypothetical protein
MPPSSRTLTAQRLVNDVVKLFSVVVLVPAIDDFLCCHAQALSQVDICREFLERVSESVYVSRWNDQPVESVRDEVGAACLIGHDYRQPGGHGLGYNETEAVLNRRKNKDVRPRKLSGK